MAPTRRRSASTTTSWRPAATPSRGTSDFDETIEPAAAEASAVDFAEVLPDLPRPLTLRHPVACQALAEAAAAAGATIHRGATDIALDADRVVRRLRRRAGPRATGRMVIGADGRTSGVRRSLGIELERYEAGHFLGGVLVDGLEFLGDDAVQYIATEAGIHALCFPQGGGRARLYIAYGDEDRERFAGADRGRAYLDAFVMRCWPGSERFPARHAGRPGQGLPQRRHVVRPTLRRRRGARGRRRRSQRPDHRPGAVDRDGRRARRHRRAHRHERLVTGLFEAYGAERLERMRRLRAVAQLYALVIGGQSWARDPAARQARRGDGTAEMLTATSVIGPAVLPDEMYSEALHRAAARRAGLTTVGPPRRR